MSDKKIVNLRMARKTKQREDKRRAGDTNAVKFGQTKNETSKLHAQNTLDKAKLDAHKLDE